jgi:hypothetical protein
MSQPKTAEMRRFQDALKSVLRVSKNDMQQMLADERKAHEGNPRHAGRKSRTSASGHAVSEKD